MLLLKKKKKTIISRYSCINVILLFSIYYIFTELQSLNVRDYVRNINSQKHSIKRYYFDNIIALYGISARLLIFQDLL